MAGASARSPPTFSATPSAPQTHTPPLSSAIAWCPSCPAVAGRQAMTTACRRLAVQQGLGAGRLLALGLAGWPGLPGGGLRLVSVELSAPSAWGQPPGAWRLVWGGPSAASTGAPSPSVRPAHLVSLRQASRQAPRPGTSDDAGASKVRPAASPTPHDPQDDPPHSAPTHSRRGPSRCCARRAGRSEKCSTSPMRCPCRGSSPAHSLPCGS